MIEAITRFSSDQCPTVTVVVVSYNTCYLTIEALRSIVDNTHSTSFEIIVVDNCSSDATVQEIKQNFPRIKLIELSYNIGFGKANNIAAKESAARFILFLNSDTTVVDGAIDKLVELAYSRPDAGVWGGRILNADGSLNSANCQRDQNLWGLFCRASGLSTLIKNSSFFNPEEYGGWDREIEREVDIVQGAFMLISRDLWYRLGGFDPIFFIYGEDADLCFRARKFGARPLVGPEPTLIHHTSRSSRNRSDMLIALLKGKATLIRRQMSPWRIPVAIALLSAWPFGRLFGARLLAFTGGKRLAKLANDWQIVWSARKSWRSGYLT